MRRSGSLLPVWLTLSLLLSACGSGGAKPGAASGSSSRTSAGNSAPSASTPSGWEYSPYGLEAQVLGLAPLGGGRSLLTLNIKNYTTTVVNLSTLSSINRIGRTHVYDLGSIQLLDPSTMTAYSPVIRASDQCACSNISNGFNPGSQTKVTALFKGLPAGQPLVLLMPSFTPIYNVRLAAHRDPKLSQEVSTANSTPLARRSYPRAPALPVLASETGTLHGLIFQVNGIRAIGKVAIVTFSLVRPKGSSYQYNPIYFSESGTTNQTPDIAKSDVSGLSLLDLRAQQRVLVLRTTAGRCLCSANLEAPSYSDLNRIKHAPHVMYAVFPLPKSSHVGVWLPRFSPVSGIAITRSGG